VRRAATLLAALCLLIAGLAPAALLAAPAAAAGGDPPALEDLATVPPGYRLSGREVLAIAAGAQRGAAERARLGRDRLFANVFVKPPGRWQVSWFQRGTDREVVQVHVDDAAGQVVEDWTGAQVAWTMARGYPGAFGRAVNSPWIWLGLTALFVLPFVDRRRGRRLVAVDLAAIASLGVSVAFFNDARIGVSVPLAYPPLLYLLGRMLWLGLRRPDPLEAAPRPLVGVRVLAGILVFLIGFRLTLNVVDSNVIDVGYSGVIGGDRLGDGLDLWGTFPHDNQNGDTYGPVAYAAYIPFEQALPWSGTWDSLDAAHAAAIAFDLTCLALLWQIGQGLGGTRLGVMLAYAWAACPFTLYVLNTNGNDGLVAALVLAAVAAGMRARAGASGALVALAGWTKFAPLALAPLFAAQVSGPKSGARRFALAFAGVTLLCAALVLGSGGLQTFADRTLGFQESRDSPFSIWGQLGDGWAPVQTVVQAAAVLLAVALAFVPRRRDAVGLAALSAAILIATQLGVSHWFYLYAAWFLGPVFVAVLGRGAGVVSPPALRPTAPAAARSRPRAAAVASSG
jgi:Glycosyltransferase family 87